MRAIRIYLLGIVLIIELGILFLTRSFSENSLSKFVESPIMNELENTKLIGQVLYTDYFYLFQISGLILLVAMVGSITLTLRDRGKVKRQNISSQNSGYFRRNSNIFNIFFRIIPDNMVILVSI